MTYEQEVTKKLKNKSPSREKGGEGGQNLSYKTVCIFDKLYCSQQNRTVVSRADSSQAIQIHIQFIDR